MEKKSRMEFIKKVYLIFAIMMFSTLIFVFICMNVPAITKFQWKYWPLLILAFIVILVIEILLFCFISISRSYPTNVILLVIFTFCFAYLIAFICGIEDPKLVFFALGITAMAFLGMTMYAYITPYDITIWWSVIFGFSLAFLVFGIILLFVKVSKIVVLIFCLLGVLLGLIYVAYDT